MFDNLFGIYNSGTGSHYESAAFKYGGLGSYNGINTKHYVKTVSVDDIDGTIRNNFATSNIGLKHNVEFRYAGVLIDPNDSTHPGMVITNPGFPTDFAKEVQAGTAGSQTVYSYSNQIEGQIVNSYNVVNLGSDAEATVVPYKYIKPLGSWSGSSGVPANTPTIYNKNRDYYQKTFTAWAERTKIGAKYKAMFEEEARSQGNHWTDVANQVIRIDGLINEQSVMLSIVHKLGGTTRYRTYAIPFAYTKNVIPNVLQITDMNGIELDRSEKHWEELKDPYNGVSETDINTKSPNREVILKKNEMYQIYTGLAYFTQDKKDSVTDRSTPLTVEITQRNRTDILKKEYDSIPTGSIANPTASEAGITDGETTGPIKGNLTTVRARGISEGEPDIEYGVGMAPYMILSFIADDSIPRSGTIYVSVPTPYAENGDDGVQSDNEIILNYRIEDDPDTSTDHTTPASFGDMNLGRREYRSLHYMDTVEEPDLEAEPDKNGEYPKKTVKKEFVTDYGTYDNLNACPEGEPVGDWQGLPSFDVRSGNEYISDTSWWEYSENWPDQMEDEEWKCWLIRDNQYDPSGTYRRSEFGHNPFDLGFTLTRSRGKDPVPNGTARVNIYGVSPETGDEGELIAEYSNA